MAGGLIKFNLAVHLPRLRNSPALPKVAWCFAGAGGVRDEAGSVGIDRSLVPERSGSGANDQPDHREYRADP